MNLSLEDISYKNILTNISLSIEAGDVIALVGANGSGKTTLLNVLMEVVHPTKGSIQRSDAQVAAVFQNNVLDDELSVQQNLYYRIDDSAAFERVIDKLNEYEINPKYKYGRLSGGQKRVVNYLRAVALQPDFLILDELTAGMDVAVRQKIWRDVQAIFNHVNCGMIFTTHLLDEMENANKVLFLESGHVKYFGDMPTFMSRMPKVKLTFADNDAVEFFDTPGQAVTFIENNHLKHTNFEILKTTYTDLFQNMEKENTHVS